MLDTGLLLIIIGLLAEKRWKHNTESHAFELAGDMTGFAPTFSQEIKTFSPNMVFAPENASEFFSPQTKQAWLDIVPGTISQPKDPFIMYLANVDIRGPWLCEC